MRIGVADEPNGKRAFVGDLGGRPVDLANTHDRADGIASVHVPRLTQGFAAESSGASVILASSYFGYPLSTTHVVSGAVIGSGLGKRLASVHWGKAGQMASGWVLTIPGAALIGAGAWEGAP
jgi:PiT family inorganic phosphate transporter